MQPIQLASSPKKYILYLRKSTDREDIQALSIPGQEETCLNFAHQNSLLIVDTIVEHRSAKIPGRPLFDRMMAQIAAGKANAILAYHPNRLARNSRDGGEIVYWLDTNKLVDLKFPSFWFENTGQGKYFLSVEFAQSKRYSDDLAQVSQRGILQKCRLGHYPGRAPLGYLNDRRTKTIVLDPHIAPAVREALELYAAGTSKISDLPPLLQTRGVMAPGRPGKLPRPVYKGTIRNILRNPFFYGAFVHAGELYQGKHTPLIGKRVFDRIQNILASRHKRGATEKVNAPFVRLMSCASCGMAITAERQRGHLYYRCTRKSKALECAQPFVREEDLAAQLGKLIGNFELPAPITRELLRRIDLEERTCFRSAKETIAKLNHELDVLEQKLNKLLESYLDRTLPHGTYLKKQQELFGKQQNILADIKQVEDNPRHWLEPFRRWVNMAQNMGEIAQTGNAFQKRSALSEIFGSNMFLDRRKVSAEAVKPWSLLAKSGRLPTTVDLFVLARTFFMESLGKPLTGEREMRTAEGSEANAGSSEGMPRIEPEVSDLAAPAGARERGKGVEDRNRTRVACGVRARSWTRTREP